MSCWILGKLTEKKLTQIFQSSSRSPYGILPSGFSVLSGFKSSPIVASLLLGSSRVNLLRLEILCCSGMNLQTWTLRQQNHRSTWRMIGDIYAATIEYRREVGGRMISVDWHLCHLSSFMRLETVQPQETISGLETNWATGTTPQGPSTSDVSNEFPE